MSSLYSIDQMKWFSDRLEEDGFTPDLFSKMGQSGNLRRIKRVLEGYAEIRPIDHHVIDLSVPCNLPFDGAERISPAKSGVVELEKRGDSLFLDNEEIELLLTEEQKRGHIGGHDLRTRLEGRGGNVSAKVLDHLVEHPELWPESWKKDSQKKTIYVFFWDDVFRDPTDGSLYVRFGCWHDGRVVSDCHWLADDWHVHDPAASLRK